MARGKRGLVVAADSFRVMRATAGEAAAVAEIYNHGMDERIATFTTRHVSAKDMRDKMVKGGEGHPYLVAVGGERRERVIMGYGSISEYSPRECYAGIGEVSVYVRKEVRGRGVGKAILVALVKEATARGYWKLIGRIFATNTASLNLFSRSGFREVGVLEKHGKLDGRWLDVVEVERVIPDNIR